VQHTPPIPANEMERLLNLSTFDIDYSNLENNFKDLIYLAAKIAGTDISLINLIDSYTQWTISNYGLDIDQMPREDSVCQYTILEDDHFEVPDLSKDDRFLNKDYVKNPLNLRYYFGIPLKTNNGYNLGALCVMDSERKKLTPEKIELLRLIANEILVRLNTIKLLQDTKNELNIIRESKQKVAHDIRGPLSGIMGISSIIKEEGSKNSIDEILEMVDLIYKSSQSVIDLADEILNAKDDTPALLQQDEFNLIIFKDKLEKLYGPQAINKEIKLVIHINPANGKLTIAKDKLIQIAGNLISNAIKFTEDQGIVTVSLDLIGEEQNRVLKINIQDTGIGMDEEAINNLLKGTLKSSLGTTGEKGYGFGLPMVKNLVDLLKGSINISSSEGKGTSFEVLLPMKMN
jgi:signal transduction histidine kinase